MFIVESGISKAAKKMSVVMGIAFVITGSFGLLLTMHIYVKPSPPVPNGFRIFGFPRTRPPASQRAAIAMTPMRKALLLVVAIAMIGGSLYLVAVQLLWSSIIYFKFVIGGCALTGLGAYVLWEDFIAPMFGIKGEE